MSGVVKMQGNLLDQGWRQQLADGLGWTPAGASAGGMAAGGLVDPVAVSCCRGEWDVMGISNDVVERPLAEEYVAAVEGAFGRCPKFGGLHLLSAETSQDLLAVRFEGPADDCRGPYGIIVRLPGNVHEERSAEHELAGEESVEDWAHAAVAVRALEAHAASRDLVRPYCRDGVWWLLRETTS